MVREWVAMFNMEDICDSKRTETMRNGSLYDIGRYKASKLAYCITQSYVMDLRPGDDVLRSIASIYNLL